MSLELEQQRFELRLLRVVKGGPALSDRSTPRLRALTACAHWRRARRSADGRNDGGGIARFLPTRAGTASGRQPARAEAQWPLSDHGGQHRSIGSRAAHGTGGILARGDRDDALAAHEPHRRLKTHESVEARTGRGWSRWSRCRSRRHKSWRRLRDGGAGARAGGVARAVTRHCASVRPARSSRCTDRVERSWPNSLRLALPSTIAPASAAVPPAAHRRDARERASASEPPVVATASRLNIVLEDQWQPMQRATNLSRAALGVARAVVRASGLSASTGDSRKGAGRSGRCAPGTPPSALRRSPRPPLSARCSAASDCSVGSKGRPGVQRDPRHSAPTEDGGGAQDEFTSVHGCSSLVLLGKHGRAQRSRPALRGELRREDSLHERHLSPNGLSGRRRWRSAAARPDLDACRPQCLCRTETKRSRGFTVAYGFVNSPQMLVRDQVD